MSASVDFVVKLNNEEDAMRVVSIIKKKAEERTPEYPSEITKFTDGIVVNGSNVEILNNYSLTSYTFLEWIPQIMTEIALWEFRGITMYAMYCSESCGHEAYYKGRIFKNGTFRMSLKQRE